MNSLKGKVRTVTFLTREQLDYLDNLGKDVLFSQGHKLSRVEILSELVKLLQNLKLDLKRINLSHDGLANEILKVINNHENQTA